MFPFLKTNAPDKKYKVAERRPDRPARAPRRSPMPIRSFNESKNPMAPGRWSTTDRTGGHGQWTSLGHRHAGAAGAGRGLAEAIPRNASRNLDSGAYAIAPQYGPGGQKSMPTPMRSSRTSTPARSTRLRPRTARRCRHQGSDADRRRRDASFLIAPSARRVCRPCGGPRRASRQATMPVPTRHHRPLEARASRRYLPGHRYLQARGGEDDRNCPVERRSRGPSPPRDAIGGGCSSSPAVTLHRPVHLLAHSPGCLAQLPRVERDHAGKAVGGPRQLPEDLQ